MILARNICLSTQNHPCLKDVRSTAQEMISEVTGERDRRLARMRSTWVGQGVAGRGPVSGGGAGTAAIPPPLRDEAAQDLLSRRESTCQEITQLKQQIRRPQGVSFAQRVRKIERLLELQPNDSQVRRRAMQVHDHLLEASRRKLKQRQYREKPELLNKIPARRRAKLHRSCYGR